MLFCFIATIETGFDNHELRFPFAQFLRQHHAQAAIAANDDMSIEVLDLLVHARRSKNLLQLVVRDELDERAGQIDHPGTADHDQDHRDCPQRRRVDRPNFAEADGEDR